MIALPLLRKKASISRKGVGCVIEGDEEALGAVLAGHDGLEDVDVGTARHPLVGDAAQGDHRVRTVQPTDTI